MNRFKYFFLFVAFNGMVKKYASLKYKHDLFLYYGYRKEERFTKTKTQTIKKKKNYTFSKKLYN